MDNDDKKNKGLFSTLVKDGLKAAWKKLPVPVKLKIIGGLGVVFLILIFFVIIVSELPSKFLDFASGISEANYEEKYKDYWSNLCLNESDGCTPEQVKQAKKIKNSQIAFFKKLDQMTSSTRQRELVLTTIFYNYDIESFIGNNDSETFTDGTGAYYVDGDNTVTTVENYVDDGTNIYKEEKDTIKELAKQFKGQEVFCEHDAIDSNTNQVVTVKDKLLKSDGSAFTFNFFESISVKYLGGASKDSEYNTAKANCENNYQLDGKSARVVFESSGDNEEAFFSYLVESSFFDKRKNYTTDFVKYADAHNLKTSELSSWSEKDKRAARKTIANNIKTIVDEHVPIENPNLIALVASSYCPNGITVEGYGTVPLDDYVLGILSAEFGSLITGNEESAKAAAVIARTYVIARSGNCTSTMTNGESNIVYKEINESTYGYDKYKAALDATAGQVLVDNSGNVKGGHFTTMPITKYIDESNGILTFHMEGIPGETSTAYDYTISRKDMERIAARAGGVYPPQESSGHHWGISQYGLTKMGEDGMTYEEILNSTYGTGGLVHLARSINTSSENGLMSNSDYTFLMRAEAVTSKDNNPYYDFTPWNVYECAWYAKYRANEILSTMNWYKTKSWIANEGNGGNGGDYCYSEAYKNYEKHYNLNEIGAVKPGMLISWKKSGVYGHVAVIEDVIGDNIIMSEAWKNNNPYKGHQYIHTVPISNLKTYTGSYGTYEFACTIDLSTGRD